MNNLLTGKLVRLAAPNPETDDVIVASWQRDTEYTRLLEVDPVTLSSAKHWRERFERTPNDRFFGFAVRALADDKLIGFVNLMGVNHVNGNAWVGIGIGERDYRGKGYGTDAMKLVLRFAFLELNLHRVTLNALATNARAIRAYEKCGFVMEGITRGGEHRNRAHDDLVTMGVLRREWENANGLKVER